MGVPARGDSAEVGKCAGIAKETRLVRHQPFRERAGTRAISPLSETEGDELDDRGQSDRPLLEISEGRAGAAGIRDGLDLQQRVRFLKT